MRTGRFEPEWNSDGRRVFRLRWDAGTEISGLPVDDGDSRRLEFARYLVRHGHLSDDLD